MTISDTSINAWIFDLFLRRENLSDLEEPIYFLAKMCQNKEEFELIQHTLERLVALSNSQFEKSLTQMVEYIRQNILSTEGPLAIVASAWGEAPDSSQELIQRLKVLLRKNDNIKFFNSVNFFERKNQVQEFPRFVMVDEFSGTGKTLIQRMEHIHKHAKSVDVEVESYICILFGMENAQRIIEAKFKNTHFCTILRAGISGYFCGEERVQKIECMKNLEQKLASEINGIALPSLGYGEAEALFFRRNSNAPNSNFPIFWWPKTSDMKDRDTIMHRAEL